MAKSKPRIRAPVTKKVESVQPKTPRKPRAPPTVSELPTRIGSRQKVRFFLKSFLIN